MDLQKLRTATATLLVLGTATAFTACDSGGGGGTASSASPSAPTTGSVPGVPVAPPTVTRNFSTDVMIFTGSGTWGTEIGDAEALFNANGITFQEVNSAQLDAMAPADMAKFGIMFMPGGAGGTEAGSVSAQTHANLRTAVQSLGLGYVGFCAGAFVAAAPAPTGGGDVSYGFGVVNAPVMDYYTGPGTSAAYEETLDTFADGHTENMLWYGGPVTPNTGVIAKYPTGDPAVSEMWSGAGFVIVAGTHPDLSASSLSGLGASPATSAQDTALKIFNAAIHQQPLPTF